MGVPYDFREIEQRWRERWEEAGLHHVDLDTVNPSRLFYNLVEFPYPSAEGLHVGHIFKYSGADAYGRYQRMLGKEVFQPIGFDAFGIHTRKDLTSARTRVANRLHAVILELVPGGYAGEIYASKVACLLEAFEPAGAVAAARKELAEELLGDLRRLDGQLAELKDRLAAVVAASGTTTAKIFGVGPVIAAITVGLTRGVGRFADKDHFAAYNGSAPIEVSSGPKKIYRLSMRSSRQLNHALHMAAVTQVRHRHSEGRVYYDKKIAEGKTGKEALRALKRRISDALYAAMVADARRAEKELGAGGPGGQTRNGSVACAAGSHPAKPALRPSHSRAKAKARSSREAARSPGLRETQRKISKAS